MSYNKRERNSSMNSYGGNNRNSSPHSQYHHSKVNNNRQRSTSSPVTVSQANDSPSSQHNQYYGKKEKGIVEKLLNSYGFVECATTGNRVFFHYSEFEGDPNHLQVGDCLDFVLTTDPRNNKPIAIKLNKLPAGSVVVETLSEESCIGRIEMEAKPQRNGEAESTLGRVSYDKSGEFFFLPFSLNDVAKGETINKGDTVEFYIATNKRTGSMKARKIRYSDPAKQVKTVQGIVSSLKEAYGFIERADVVDEIFFHYSEYSADINELMIGDDVQFNLQDRLGKEIAVSIKKLSPGTVVFEDISENRFKGHVIKAIGPKSMNSSMDGQLTGMIEYQGKTDTHEVLFGDRDMEDDIILQKGDVVEFNVSTDRRDKLQRAVNIKLISVCLKNGQTREVGVVSSLKEGFGFIKCADQDLSIFFHFSEVLEQSHLINLGDEVEFTIQNDQISQRQHATRIRFLPKGTVSFEIISSKRHVGVIDREAPERQLKSPSKTNRENEFGIIKCYLEGQETDILYRVRDCRPREMVRYRDKVEFVLVTKKTNQQRFARDVSILEKSETKMLHGYVCALKDSYGFIETEDHTTELFFHFSEYEGDTKQLELGSYVMYAETRKGEKRSAEKVCKILSHVCKDEILPQTYDGVITRPMRTMDPDQDEYEGLIQLSRASANKQQKQQKHNASLNGSLNGSSLNGSILDDSTASTNGDAENGEDEKSPATNGEQQQLVYRFGITAIMEKKEAIQVGDKVSFQICIDAVTKKKRACNVACKRSLLRGKVESVKGQFGFIAYNHDDGKSVFFHMSEVQNENGKELKQGDEVSFMLVQNHKNAKKSAIRVQKIIDERPEHLLRRRSHKFSESQTFKVSVLRHPTGPDGTTGFALKRKSIASEAEMTTAATTDATATNEELVLENGAVCEDTAIKESMIKEQVEALSVA
ncbi:cold shock domain-containing protein E1-like [Clytia hemisphaerica]|uniref:Cold shock domain-containing protein E1 n=1 Tax=Clytia hemisphaerica TaxID=252671 RepID=A0A7M5XBS2_9CNID